MKQKIKVIHNGKEISGEINIRDTSLIGLTQKYPSRTFKSKKVYTRKIKHK